MNTDDKKAKLKKIKKILLITDIIVFMLAIMLFIRDYNGKKRVPNNSGYGKDINSNMGSSIVLPNYYNRHITKL